MESLEKMQELASKMVIGPSKNMKNRRKEMVPFQKGIICSIQATLSLWKELQSEGFSYLLTSKLNQDCIENFFSTVCNMGGADTNPDPVQFCNRIRILKLTHNIDAIPSILKNSNISLELSKVDEEGPEEVMAEAGEEEQDRV